MQDTHIYQNKNHTTACDFETIYTQKVNYTL